MRIPEEKLNQIRDAVDLVDIVSAYVPLKKRGKSYVGLCPFHSEKTPSFYVDPSRGFYHCFGCGAGGNVFTFVMQMEKIGFVEAAKILAEKAGIPLPVSEYQGKEKNETELLYQVNEWALEFFRNALWNTPDGKKAEAYIRNRGFDSSIIEKFQIGYAANQWDRLLKQGEKRGFSPELLYRAGLVVPRKEGKGYYDRFRDRLMFPLLNPTGRVVGFAGRILGEASPHVPKYMNTPETPIYQKSQFLYGLYYSKEGIRRKNQVLVVEGYTDVMRFFQTGYDYVVASGGTALTEAQAKLLSRYIQRVSLVFDGDSAGFQAALRGIGVVISAGLRVTVTPLPEGLDPDGFLLKYGKEAMENVLQNASSFIDFHIKQKFPTPHLASSQEKVGVIRELLSIVSKIQDPLERQLVIKEIAEKLDVEEQLLLRELRTHSYAPSFVSRVENRIFPGKKEKAEKGILGFLLLGEKAKFSLIFRYLDSGCFGLPLARQLFEEMHRRFTEDEIFTPEQLLSFYQTDPDMLVFLSQIFSEPIQEGREGSQFGLDCLLTLIEEKYQPRMEAIRRKLKTTTDPLDLEKAQKEWVACQKELKSLKLAIIEEWKTFK